MPFILAHPAKTTSHGQVTTALVESVDMYPSLAIAAGLPPDALQGSLEGYSTVPLLDDPHLPWKKAAFSQYARCGLNVSTGYYARCSNLKREDIEVMGYSVRTAKWRFTEWFAFNGTQLKANFSQTLATELYSHKGDDGSDMDRSEVENVVYDPVNAAVVAKHKKIIREGWRKQLPTGR